MATQISAGMCQDAVTRHNPAATIASRGCPVGCWFCIVPAMEGREFILIDDFEPRPILCDNNLSKLPAEFQDHIGGRAISEAEVPLMDANSGFESATFDDEVLASCGSPSIAVRDASPMTMSSTVRKCVASSPCSQRPVLIARKRKRVYVLIGNEPMAACLERIRDVIAWGGEPHCQPLLKLNARSRRVHGVRHDWIAEVAAGTWRDGRIGASGAMRISGTMQARARPTDPAPENQLAMAV